MSAFMMRIKFDQCILLLALVWFGITAYFNDGYYHADEHYQIIEFAQVLNGKISGDHLPWEFHERIRPSLQPVICYIIFIACDYLHITDPFTKAFVLRLITAVLAASAIYWFSKSCRRFIPDNYWKPFLVLSFFLWFIPFLNVRFSSEAWSGLFLIFSIILALKQTKSNSIFLATGIVAGISFLFRYQIAFASAGLFLWLFIVDKSKIRYSIPYIIGFIMVVMLGVILDTWFYGEFVITPWRYFKVNILNDVASDYGTSPWYHYFYSIFRYSFFPIGIAIIVSLLVVAYKKPLSIFSWIIIPFLLVHIIIPHKELRFLFPLINLVPAVVIIAFSEIDTKQKFSSGKIFKAVLYGLIALNLASMITSNLKPADRGRINLAEKITEFAKREHVDLYYTGNSNPFEPYKGLVSDFYLDPLISFRDIRSFNDTIRDSSKSVQLLVVYKADLDNPDINRFIEINRFRKVNQSIPEYFIPFLKTYGGYKIGEIIILYEKELVYQRAS